VVDAPRGAAPFPVVALGHHQLGEEAKVGQLFAFGRGGDLAEPLADGGQAQHPRAESIAATVSCSVTPRRVADLPLIASLAQGKGRPPCEVPCHYQKLGDVPCRSDGVGPKLVAAARHGWNVVPSHLGSSM
jgi:hypothetical protein